MDKVKLFKQQPIVTQVLSKALLSNRLSHAYLFSGPKNANKLAWAYLLAQSYICTNKDELGFACSTCNECARIEKQLYADLIVIDPNQSKPISTGMDTLGSSKEKKVSSSIKKEDIQRIQKQFSQSALESSGKKVYIINDVDKATPEALNSLLKFLEEPNESILAILISDSISNVLPTIVSRCQTIHFKKCVSVGNEKTMTNEEELIQYLAKNCLQDSDEVDSEDTDFLDAYGAAKTFLNTDIKHFNETMIRIEQDFISSKSFTKRGGSLFFMILYHIYRLLIMDETSISSIFGTINMRFKNNANGLLLLVKIAQKFERPYYAPLVYEQGMAQLKEELQ